MIAVSPILHNNNTISQGWTGKEKNNIPVLGNYSKLKYICFIFAEDPDEQMNIWCAVTNRRGDRITLRMASSTTPTRALPHLTASQITSDFIY